MCNLLSHVAPKVLFVVYLVLIFAAPRIRSGSVAPGGGGGGGGGLVLRAVLSQWGLHGELTLRRGAAGRVALRAALRPTLERPEHALRWAVHAFPVDHRDVTAARCGPAALGPELFDLTEELGFLLVPGKESAEFETARPLTGPGGFWGRSLRLESAEGRVSCASILAADDADETYAEARFLAPVAGTVGFRWLAPADGADADADVTLDLYRAGGALDAGDYTEHAWKLFVTDVFDSDRHDHEDSCDALQTVFEPAGAGGGPGVGDLDARLGPARVAVDPRRPQRSARRHAALGALRRDMAATSRSLYLVLYDHRRPDAFLACAKLRLVPPQTARVVLSMGGARGEVRLRQRAPHAPTWATFELSAAAADDYEAELRFASSVRHYGIRELPPLPGAAAPCNHTGGLYNPSGVDLASVPPPGMGSQDQYAVGDLLGKLLRRSPERAHRYLLPAPAPELAGSYWDAYLPLSGARSVRHRALLVQRYRYLLPAPAPAPELAGSYWDAYLPLSGARSVRHRALLVQRYRYLLPAPAPELAGSYRRRGPRSPGVF